MSSKLYECLKVFFAISLIVISVYAVLHMWKTTKSDIYNPKLSEFTINFVEVDTLRCDNVMAIGCTTVISNHNYKIEYISNKHRCQKEGCIQINDTINHEIWHVLYYEKYGYFNPG